MEIEREKRTDHCFERERGERVDSQMEGSICLNPHDSYTSTEQSRDTFLTQLKNNPSLHTHTHTHA